MSDKNGFGFGAFVPGFDFLQGLVQSASSGAAAGTPPGLPDWSKWVAPTLQPDEIEKRVKELKTVQFWLEQNARALSATIQALEVQKMTLATLKGMNMQVKDLAGAFGFGKAGAGEALASFAAPFAAAVPPARPAGGSGPYDDMLTPMSGAADAAPAQAPRPDTGTAAAATPPAPDTAGGPAAIDPMQWWNALTGQFQQIAAGAMQGAAEQARQNPGLGLQAAALKAFDAAGRMAADVTAAATGAATRSAGKATATPRKRRATATPAASAVSARKSPAAAPKPPSVRKAPAKKAAPAPAPSSAAAPAVRRKR